MSDWYSKEMDWKWNVGNIWGKLTHPFTETFHWIVKSIQYAIFLRKDFDWDYSYILRLLRFKLKRTRKQILENNLILRADEIAAQIEHAEKLIDKWEEDEFCVELREAHEEKWGKLVDRSEPIESDNGIKLYTWNWSRENATTPELEEQEKKESMEIYEKQDQAKEKNLDELFAHMRRYMQSWWD